MLIVLSIGINTFVVASDISLYNNNTAGMNSGFAISETGEASVLVNYEGYPNIATGATITIKIEKRNLLFFWSDVVNDTITVVGHRYFDELDYQLEDKGTYRCTVVYTIFGNGRRRRCADI
jgi:hypothetical protein